MREKEREREREREKERERERERERGVFRGPALASWHLTICQNSPRFPTAEWRCVRSLNCARLRRWWPSASPFALPTLMFRAALPPPAQHDYYRVRPSCADKPNYATIVDCATPNDHGNARRGTRARKAGFPISSRVAQHVNFISAAR